jgi:hypothetical protein
MLVGKVQIGAIHNKTCAKSKWSPIGSPNSVVPAMPD